MKQRNARSRRRRRWYSRERAAQRTPEWGYGNRDAGHLMRTVERLRTQNPDTYDDLDRYILETFGS